LSEIPWSEFFFSSHYFLVFVHTQSSFLLLLLLAEPGASDCVGKRAEMTKMQCSLDLMDIFETANIDTGVDALVGELLRHIRLLPTVDQCGAWKLVSKAMLAVDKAIDAETL